MPYWTPMSLKDALAAIKQEDMVRLPVSCVRYKYYSSQSYPMLRLDTKGDRFAYCPDWKSADK